MKPTLLVLAAGMGSRYGGLKQLDPVGPSGEIIIDYSIYDAIQAGFGKVVFLIRRDIEDIFRESIGKRYEGKIEVDYAFQAKDDIPESFTIPAEREKPWGTGQAVLAAESVINEPFAVINADDFYGRSGFQLLTEYFSDSEKSDSVDFSMVGFVLRNTLSEHGTVSRGVCKTDADGFLQNVNEITKIAKCENGAKNLAEGEGITDMSGDEIVSMNMWGFTPEIFPELRKQFVEFLEKDISTPKSEFYLPFAVDTLIKKGLGKVKVLKSVDHWFGVTYQEDKPVVIASIQKLVDDGVYPGKLF